MDAYNLFTHIVFFSLFRTVIVLHSFIRCKHREECIDYRNQQSRDLINNGITQWLIAITFMPVENRTLISCILITATLKKTPLYKKCVVLMVKQSSYKYLCKIFFLRT